MVETLLKHEINKFVYLLVKKVFFSTIKVAPWEMNCFSQKLEMVIEKISSENSSLIW